MLSHSLLLAPFGVASATNAAGLTFPAENKNKPGVATLPSGLQYTVLRAGRGGSHPPAAAPRPSHYAGHPAPDSHAAAACASPHGARGRLPHDSSTTNEITCDQRLQIVA